MKIRELLEARSVKLDTTKPRNFVAKNAKTGGAGAHKDKKKAVKQGDAKHKKKELAYETATAGSTSAGNISVGPVYKNKPGKTFKNKDGTAKNALDVKGANLLTGGSIKR
jgi:hypothetical protein